MAREVGEQGETLTPERSGWYWIEMKQIGSNTCAYLDDDQEWHYAHDYPSEYDLRGAIYHWLENPAARLSAGTRVEIPEPTTETILAWLGLHPNAPLMYKTNDNMVNAFRRAVTWCRAHAAVRADEGDGNESLSQEAGCS